ncbi:related to ribosomal protein of the large subunit, mitochondrial [Cephalotrichum gorgonifer]|uniref:Large ribosomal subunit protein bL28m n=1 Tax=Cephalotrichum gorgonifer TaxID=2041049 RepID=A0AAE8N572_9PEZI|nr:related to ribosomal protein of the large subunit, mitochondrial [Cephalotrichum gorgonifer]
MPPTQGLPLTRALSALRIQSTTTTAALATAAARPFSTTPARPTKTIQAHKVPPPLAPAYPPGPRPLYKQSNGGLYALSRIRFGNNVSGRNPTKTPRTWKPNVHRKKLWSESLGAWVKTRLTTRVLRTIRKEGGLDNYLTAHGKKRVEELGPAGWRLRWLVMQTEAMQERFSAEREKLGLETKEMGEEEKLLRSEKVQIALDYATPGGLSRSTRDILERRGMMLEQEYGLGEAGDDVVAGAGLGANDVEVDFVELEGEAEARAQEEAVEQMIKEEEKEAKKKE